MSIYLRTWMRGRAFKEHQPSVQGELHVLIMEIGFSVPCHALVNSPFANAYNSQSLCNGSANRRMCEQSKWKKQECKTIEKKALGSLPLDCSATTCAIPVATVHHCAWVVHQKTMHPLSVRSNVFYSQRPLQQFAVGLWLGTALLR